MPHSADTSPEAERVLVAALRAMSPARKWAILRDTLRTATRLHEAGVLLRDPAATPKQIRASWRAVALGDGPWNDNREDEAMTLPEDQLEVIREVVAAFSRLDIPYALGGSLASTLHGSPRFTLDADISVDPFPGRETELVACFGPDYYVSLPAVEQAVRERSTFNIIKPASAFKVDVFVRKDRPFEQTMMARRLPSAVLGPGEPTIDTVTPEDIILLKLEWYRLGNEVSERQWSDVLGVLRMRSETLDLPYLEHWASELNVADLLARARGEAGT